MVDVEFMPSDKNSFNGFKIETELVPTIVQMQKSHMQSHDLVECQHSLYMKDGYVDFQFWNISVVEHKDHAGENELFMMTVVELKHKPSVNYEFDMEPVFSYTDHHGNPQKDMLKAGKSYVFNPVKPHYVMYLGMEYLVALTSVKGKS